MRGKLKYLFLALAFILVAFVNGVPFIFGDGYGYYHNAKSLVTERSFYVSIEPEYYKFSGHGVIKSGEKYITPYSPGNAILWLPFLSFSNQFDSGTAYDDYYKAFNGHSFADGLAILAAACFYSYLGITLTYGLLRNLGFGIRNSSLSTILVFASSFVFYYIFEQPAYSHAYEIFSVAAFLYCITKFGKKFEYKYFFFAGIFASLSVLTRLTNILIIAPIFFYILLNQKKKAVVYFIAGGTPLLLILLYYNYVSYGDLFTTGYSFTGQGFTFDSFYLKDLLFSSIRGWFVYSPFMVAALVGLFLYARRTLQGWLLYILPVLVTIIIYSFWPNWWGGDAMGQRFLLSLVPFMAIGAAHLGARIMNYTLLPNSITRNQTILKYARFILYSIFFLTASYSLCILLLHRFTPTDELFSEMSKPRNWYQEIPKSERFTPFDIFTYHKDLAYEATDLKDYATKLKESFNGGRSIALLVFGQTTPLLITQADDPDFINLHIVPNNTNENIKASFGLITFCQNRLNAYSINNLETSQHRAIKIVNQTGGCFIPETENIKESFSPLENLKGELTFKYKNGMGLWVLDGKNIKWIDPKLKREV